MRLPSLTRAALLFAAATRCFAQQGHQAPIYGESGDACHNACVQLKSTLPTQTYHSLNPDSVPAPDLKNSFFAVQQQEIIPACWLTPTSAQDVSVALNIVRDHGCHFAVKSGGHAPNEGASNADGGVTFDMRLFDAVDCLGDDGRGETTRVGTGGRWGNVYARLEEIGKTVIGGRDQRVGVGGAILGGGISFISRRYGWALDNVRNYEVILANGSISQINQNTAPDLYWALRGGGNNFGIVTHFDLETYPLTQAWGGYNFYLLSDLSSIISSLSLPSSPRTFSLKTLTRPLGHLINNIACKFGYCITLDSFISAFLHGIEAQQTDLDAQNIVSLGYAAELDLYIPFWMPIYSKPEPYPEVFEAFSGLQRVWSSNRVANFSSFHKELDTWNAGGFRQVWGTISIKPSHDLIRALLSIFLTETSFVKDIKDLLPSIVMQTITTSEIHHMSKNGGNCLGIKPDDGPIIIYAFTIHYSRKEDDERIRMYGKRIVEGSTRLAKEMGLHHSFIYQNYADDAQDVFSGYGEENRGRLRAVKRKWDPEDVFGGLVRGHFKVG